MYAFKLMLSLFLVLATASQSYSAIKKPVIKLLENEPIEATTTSENLKHLVRMKKKADELIFEEEKEMNDTDKDNVNAPDKIVNSTEKTNSDSSSSGFLSNFSIGSAFVSDQSNNVSTNDSAIPTDKVYNQTVNNPNDSLTYGDELNKAEDEQKKKNEEIAKQDREMKADDTGKSFDNEWTGHNSTNSTDFSLPGDETSAKETINQSTPSSKIIDTIMPNNKTSNLTARHDPSNHGSMDVDQHNRLIQNGTQPSSANTQQASIFSLFACIPILWFVI